jgi:hypothetical protein
MRALVIYERLGDALVEFCTMSVQFVPEELRNAFEEIKKLSTEVKPKHQALAEKNGTILANVMTWNWRTKRKVRQLLLEFHCTIHEYYWTSVAKGKYAMDYGLRIERHKRRT